MLYDYVDKATEAFLKIANIGNDPALETRSPGWPVGLRVRIMPSFHLCSLRGVQNLGATCYANASLQVRCVHLLLLECIRLDVGVVSRHCISDWRI